MVMKVGLSEYRSAQKKAETQCKAAFDKAAKAYRDKGDVKAAGEVLEEMKEFMAKTPGTGIGGGAMVIGCVVSNKVLGLSGSSTDENTKIVTADYVKSDQTQLWKVVSAGNGWHYIENVKSGLVMTANGKNNGVECVIARKQQPASDNQLWKIAPAVNAKGAQRVSAKPSGKYIGVDAKSKDAGARILIWTDQPTEAAQMFAFAAPK